MDAYVYFSVCVHTLVCTSLRKLCLSTERREGKTLEVQEKKAAPCLFEYCRNIYQLIIFNSLISFNKQAYIMYNQNPVVLTGNPGAGWGKKFCLVIYEDIRCWFFIYANYTFPLSFPHSWVCLPFPYKLTFLTPLPYISQDTEGKVPWKTISASFHDLRSWIVWLLFYFLKVFFTKSQSSDWENCSHLPSG